MQITSNAAYYSGLSAIQAGLNLVDKAASSVASQQVSESVTNQSTDQQAQRLYSVDKSQQQDLATGVVQMVQGKLQADAGSAVLGSLVNTFA
ncbi:pyrroloquinoline quinone biosynthesis protein PqqE [Pseudomonas sp. HR96]|uniref:pyrroloquinoline quinone biosynthesis protein PqqE n=1 Tax=Pseudomonas sp. HR96 TaxID=1027966 RepID=UPI002A74FA4C|nr:pyrroloquinoline quinone biosynthesis protein PqqE [Pseudomonas sp. HR96]WPP00331.1 pyrroloquinoline quinone biosynthesis protein PqqE [Pseudomonas sp. HR96]